MAELKKSLGFWSVFSITVTAMIGTGMFFGTAFAANIAGNASIFVWIILGLLTIYVGACFGELTSMFPSAGGIYEFAKQAYGKGLWSFLIGWTSWIVINIMNSLLIVAALDYLMPAEYGVLVKVALSIAIIIILNMFAYMGTESISAVLGFFAILIIVVLLSIIGIGFNEVNYTNYIPLFTGPLVGLFVALFFIVETFFGWENATFMAEETKDAERTIPSALMWGSVFVSVLGILLAFVMLGVIPHTILAQSSTPLSDLTAILFNTNLAMVVNIGIALALIGSAAGGLVGSPRLLLGLARDKFFIEQLADIHPKYQTPYKAIIFQVIVSIIVVLFGFGKYEYLLALLVPLALLMYISVLLAVPVLRFKKPNHPRPFKVIFGKTGPIIVSLLYVGTVAAWLLTTPGAQNMINLGLSFILFGVPIFLLLISYYDPESIKSLNDSFAQVALFFENMSFPKNFRKELLEYFKDDLYDKTVLDYGAGVGTLTMHLAENVGPKGKVYATDLSKKNTEIILKRVLKRGYKNIEVIHDEHQVNRVHPSVRSVDAVFSVGMLGYIQDTKKVLRELYKILPRHGKICMVEYVDYFWIIPNVKWLSSDENIQKVFKDAGFSVHIKRKRRLFWTYIIIYGIKTTDGTVPFI
ncbi:MAG TPA: amino acid permease [Alphaproteobacteria bacterium]|nr:amino acid permease [Alphaproteobacteria bacterium]